MLQKRKEIAAILQTLQQESSQSDTPTVRQNLTIVLQRNEILCGKLAMIVQSAASFRQVLAEELDEIVRAPQIRTKIACTVNAHRELIFSEPFRLIYSV